MGFCAMLLDFLGAKDCKKPLLSASYGWVIMQEWQTNRTPTPWVNMQEWHLRRGGEHPGTVGEHNQEWWVNMVRNLQVGADPASS